jgi:ubiquinone/menaquinone biosynthesis C-methylase UbiE
MSFARSTLMRAFGRPSGVLGRIGGLIMARTNRACAEWVCALIEPREGDRILEIGFGPGVAIELLAQGGKPGRVAGIDVSDEMVGQANRRNAAAIARGLVELRHAAVDGLPYPDENFDKVLAINSMQAWPDALAGLREIRRVLRPGGLLALAFTPHSGQKPEGLTDKLAAAGFADARLVRRDELFCVLANRT